MKKRLIHLAALALTVLMGVAQAATVTVTVVDDGVSNIGDPGTFYWALTNCNAGDTIAFNIPGAGPHYLQIPPGGFPIIHRKGNLLIDGYTQPGASANTNPITNANNAVIKIVVDGRNGNCRDMRYNLFGTTVISDPPIDNSFMATERPGLTGTGESALLGIYRSTNVNVRGVSFLGAILTSAVAYRQKGIVIEMDYDGNPAVLPRYAYASGSSDGCHINGCWFGVNPTNPTLAGSLDQAYRVSITTYRHTDTTTGTRPVLVNSDLTIGVKKGSANPRAEFNVMAGVGGFLSTDSLGLRVSGNFISVLPDGVTPFNFLQDSLDIAQFRGGWFDVGCRFADELKRPNVIGTDGDGVNDADEGNLFGPMSLNPVNGLPINIFGFFNSDRNPFIIAGNRFGIGVDGTIWTNNAFNIGSFRLDQGTQARFGSDFNGVSDALEANVIYNMNVFADVYPSPSGSVARSFFHQTLNNFTAANPKDGWLSARGNVNVNNLANYNPDDTGTASRYYNVWSNYITDATGNLSVPALDPSSTVALLKGTFNVPNINSYYTNAAIVDVYLPDPQGQINGASFNYAFFGGTSGPGFVQGQTHLGAFLDNGPYDSDPAVGAFSLNISSLGLAASTKVTVAVTYSSFARPQLTGISRSGTSTTLAWTGDNGGPYSSGTAGGATSGFGIQRASNVNGPWTTVAFAPTNGTTLNDAASTSFYRIVGPVSGMTTLFAPPVALNP